MVIVIGLGQEHGALGPLGAVDAVDKQLAAGVVAVLLYHGHPVVLQVLAVLGGGYILHRAVGEVVHRHAALLWGARASALSGVDFCAGNPLPILIVIAGRRRELQLDLG